MHVVKLVHGNIIRRVNLAFSGLTGVFSAKQGRFDQLKEAALLTKRKLDHDNVCVRQFDCTRSPLCFQSVLSMSYFDANNIERPLENEEQLNQACKVFACMCL